jgi:hypothetical protein
MRAQTPAEVPGDSPNLDHPIAGFTRILVGPRYPIRRWATLRYRRCQPTMTGADNRQTIMSISHRSATRFRGARSAGQGAKRRGGTHRGAR